MTVPACSPDALCTFQFIPTKKTHWEGKGRDHWVPAGRTVTQLCWEVREGPALRIHGASSGTDAERAAEGCSRLCNRSTGCSGPASNNPLNFQIHQGPCTIKEYRLNQEGRCQPESCGWCLEHWTLVLCLRPTERARGCLGSLG